MKFPIFATLVLAPFATTVWANDAGDADGSAAGTALVSNNHGGYNVTEPGARHGSLPFFGTHGYATKVIAESHEPPKFILVPVVEDVGHGGKVVVFKKIYFATAEEAAAAKANMKY